MSVPPVLAVEAVGLRKVYGPTVALAAADFQVASGEIHGLLGENGAGKSTLVRILAGVEQADAGSLQFFGSPARGGPADRRAAGLAFIHQDLGLFHELSVADNIALSAGFPRRAGLIDERGTLTAARDVVSRIGMDVDVRRPVGELTLADQTVVAVCRSLAHGARLIVLDEPTAYLEAQQVRVLFDLLGRLRDDGVACVLISHRSEDVLRVCDRVTVLRDGRDIARRRSAELSETELVRLITGRTDRLPTRAAATVSTGSAVSRLQVDGLRGAGFGPVSFRVAPGEIVGICGLADAGQNALGEALCGLLEARGGTMKLDDEAFAPRDINAALRAGVGIVPANRIRDGLAGSLTAAENLLMKPRGAWWRPLSRRQDTAESMRLLTRYSVQPAIPDREVATFSGGNQQKIMLAKWLGHGRRLIVLNEPSAGVDVGAKADIHQQIRTDCDATTSSAIVISTDFQEIADLCDRALVMRRGAVVGELTKQDLHADVLTELAYGGGTVTHQIDDRSRTVLSKPGAATASSGSGALFARAGKFGLLALLLLVFAGFSLARPEQFATWLNVKTTLDQNSPVIIGALAAMLPLLSGSFDLSVAANMSLGNIVLAVLTTNRGWGVVPALVVTVLLTSLVGLVNGLVVERLQVNSFVATLGMATLLGGVGLAVTNSTDVLSVPDSVTTLARTEVLGLPLSVVYALAVVLIVAVVLRYLPVGRKLRAVGANRKAAALTGIRPDIYVISSFTLAGTLAGIGGIVLTSQLGSATAAGTANGLLLPIFAAVFLGSTAFTPGRQNVPGTVVAALFLSFTSSGLVLIGAAQWAAPMINGAALILAVALSSWALRLRASRFRAQQLRQLDADPVAAHAD